MIFQWMISLHKKGGMKMRYEDEYDKDDDDDNDDYDPDKDDY